MSEARQEHTLEQHTTVEVTRHVEATAERVFDAWTEPSGVERWMLAPAEGAMESVALDASVGGAFSFVVRREGHAFEHTGEYLAVERPRRLSFTWRVPRLSLETSVVTVEVVAIGDECEVTLRHEGVFAEDAARTEQGWTAILESVASIASESGKTSRGDEGTRDEARSAQEDTHHDVR